MPDPKNKNDGGEEEYVGRRYILTIKGNRVSVRPNPNAPESEQTASKQYLPHGLKVIRGHCQNNNQDYMDLVAQRIIYEQSKGK